MAEHGREGLCAVWSFFGLLYLSIGILLVLSLWFTWENITLTDLGHSINSDIAAIFNSGLFLAGFLLMIYAITVFKNTRNYRSFCLLASTFLVQLIAVFNAAYCSRNGVKPCCLVDHVIYP